MMSSGRPATASRHATTVTAFHYLAVAWLMLQRLILLTSRSSHHALAIVHQHLYGLQLALHQPLERRRQLLRRDLQLEDSGQA